MTDFYLGYVLPDEWLEAIKGLDWEAIDNLHEIAKGLRSIRTDIYRDLVVTSDVSISNNAGYLNLTVVEEALVSAPNGQITVFGDCRILSGGIQAQTLEVFGDLTVERAPLDSSYTNVLDVDNLIVHGNATIKNTQWLPGYTAAQMIAGNLTMDDITEFHDGTSGFEAASGQAASSNALKLLVGGNITSNMTALDGAGKDAGVAGEGYQGLGFILMAAGDITMSGLVSVDATGGENSSGTGGGTETGGGGGSIVLAAGGTLTVGTNLVLDAGGGDATNVDGDDGGDAGDIDVYYGTAFVGSIQTATVTGGTGTPNGADGTYTNTNAIMAGHMPAVPTATTADGATTATLAWDVPVDINGDDLDFEVEIQEMLSGVVWLSVLLQNSNDDAGQFSGTPPYTEGTGSVTYTIPAGLTTGDTYRWRVTALKDGDTANVSVPSEWREFVMA